MQGTTALITFGHHRSCTPGLWCWPTWPV